MIERIAPAPIGRRRATRLATLVICSAILSCARQTPPPAASAPATSPPAASLPAVPYEAHLAAGGIAPAGGALYNPHAGDAAVARSGALLFSAMNCDGCHGAGAAGWVGPDLADGRWRYGGADAEVFYSIYYGRPKGMPAFGGALGVEGVWTLVTYLRSLPPPADLPTQSWEPK